jgi:hypothetical protein
VTGPSVSVVTIHEDDLQEKLLPRLLGRVFHVTSIEGYEGIKRSEAILSNQEGKLAYVFPQSAISYGHKRGYVCLFDLRGKKAADLEIPLQNFRPPDLDEFPMSRF